MGLLLRRHFPKSDDLHPFPVNETIGTLKLFDYCF